MKNLDLDIRTLSIHDSTLRAVKNDDGTMTITGQAVVFSKPSEVLTDAKEYPTPFIEYIDPHALDGVDFSNLYLLYGHNFNDVLSRADAGTLKVAVTDNGLSFTATMPNTTLAHDTYENIRAGNVKGCSFGFNIAPGGDTYKPGKDGVAVHYISQIQNVDELTLTPIPAYTQTSVSVQRSLNQLKKEETRDMENSSATSSMDSSAVASQESSTAANSSAAITAADVGAAIRDALKPVNSAISSLADRCGGTDDTNDTRAAKRDDENVDDTDVDDADADVDDDETDEKRDGSSAASSSAESSAASSSATSSGTSSAATSSSAVSAASSSATRAINPENTKEDETVISIKDKSTMTNNDDKRDALTRSIIARDDYKHRDAQPGTVTLSNQGKFFLPDNILKAYQENHQFARLNQFVTAQNVTLPTGKVPYFDENDQVAQTRNELSEAADFSMTDAKSVPYDVKAYSAKIRFSREQIAAGRGGNTDLMQIAQGQMAQIQNNTDDAKISDLLVNNATNKVTASDVIADMKTVLNVTLQPNDAEASQIVLTQSAFNAIDQLKDNFGRPLMQPDPTKSSSYTLFGKPVIKVKDTLLGKKIGDKMAVIAPLKKSIYKFTLDKVQGQFIDNFSSFDVILGIFFMQDIVAVRPDLMSLITITDKSLAASDTSTSLGK